MSYFGTQLDELLKRKKMKAVDLARLSGVGEAMISRYRKGDYTWLSLSDLANLAGALSHDPTERAELIKAHLLDERQGPGAELIQITISGRGALQEQPTAYQVKLPADLERHFAIIREWSIKDRNVREVIEGLGSLLASNSGSELKDSSAELDKLANQITNDAAEEVTNSAKMAAGSSGTPHSAAAPSPVSPTALPKRASERRSKKAPAGG